MSKALARTRIRCQTLSADNKLLHTLLLSMKDMLKNKITRQFIWRVFLELKGNG